MLCAVSEHSLAELRNGMKALIVSNLERGFSAGHLSMIGPLQELGYEVTWASNFSEFRGDISSFPCRTVQIDFVRHPLHPGNLKAYRQLTRLMREEDFRLVHCNSPVGGVLGRICGARAGVPTILYTVHGFHFYKGAPPVNRVVYRSVEILLARHTDALITINHEDYEAAKRFRLRNGGKAYRIPGIGVDTKAVERAVPKRAELLNQIGADDSSVVLISVGELNENKNHRAIIRALGMLRNRAIHYVLCGTGGQEARLALLARQLGLESNVHFLGYRTAIYELLKSSDVFALPSYREGLPRSMMEAMASGLPCVASRIRGNIDLIEDGRGGFLRHPDDIQGLADSINELAGNEELRKRMGASNLVSVQKYDVEVVRREITGIFEKELT